MDLTELSEFFRNLVKGIDLSRSLQIGLLLGTIVIGFRVVQVLVLRLTLNRVSDQTQMLLKKAFGWSTLTVLVLVFFGALGFDLSAVLGAAGIAGLALGFAAQTSISNVISGLFLLSEKPFAVGDVISTEGVSGVVQSIDTLSVKVRTFDNTFVRVPNETVIKSIVVNVTRFPVRRLDLVLTIPFHEDLAKALNLIQDVVAANRYALANPEMFLMVKQFGPVGTEVSLGVWFERSDLVDLKNSLAIEILDRFKAEKIQFPKPWMEWRDPVSG